MRKIFDWLTVVLPCVWGVLWMIIITVGSLALIVWVVKWLMTLLGVL